MAADAAVMVDSTESLAEKVCELLAKPQQREQMGQAALNLIVRSQGASSRLVNLIKHHILPYAK